MEQEQKLKKRLSLIKIDGSLKDFKNKDDSFDLIVDYLITKFKNYKELKQDLGFLNVVTNIVETLIKTKDKKNKLDKKEFVIRILNHIFQLTPDEVEWFKKQIDYLFEQGKITPFKKSLLSKSFKYGKLAMNFFL